MQPSANYEDCAQGLMRPSDDVVIANAQDANAECSEVVIALVIVGTPSMVDGAIDLDGEPKLGTGEVDDVAGDDVLSTKLPSTEAAAS